MPEWPGGRRPSGVTPAVIGIDLGTTEAKAALVGLDGQLLELGRAGYPTATGPDGRAEQDPRDWYAAIASVVRPWFAQARQAGTEPRLIEVLAICCVGQGPTVAAVDSAGDPVRPALTWQDRRPGESGFGLLPRLSWLASADDRVKRSRWLLSSWDAVGLWLTGEAAWTLQGHERAPSSTELAQAGVRADLIPGARPFGSVLGSLRPSVGERLGLSPGGIPVIAGVNDGTASMLGAGLLRPGDAVDTGGTSGGLGVYADHEVSVPGLFSAPAPIDGLWVAGGAMAALGASVDWLRGPILGGWPMEELQVAAADVPSGAGGLVFLPYLAGERAPVFDDDARGALFGLTLAHDRRHIARAVLEGTGFAMRSVAEPLAAAGAPIRELRLTGRPGGGDTWAQVKADVLGVPVAIPAVGDTAVLGAAILAAAGIGAVGSLVEGVATMTSIARRLDPDPASRDLHDDAFGRYRALYPALRDA